MNQFQNFLLNFDRYSCPIELNVNGHKSISSLPGTITTFTLMAILLLYAIIKFQMLIYFQNPQIGQAVLKTYFDIDYKVNLTDLGFKIAFGVNDYKNGSVLDDPNYVQWIVRLNRYENQRSVNTTTNIKFHKCTQRDFDQFYPPSSSSIESVMSVKSYSLYCIDEE